MKVNNKLFANERGIAHIGLVLVVIVFVGVGSLVYWRFQNADTDSKNANTSKVTADDDLYEAMNSSVEDVDNNADVSVDEVEVE